MRRFLPFLLLACAPCWAQWIPDNPVTGVQRESDGVLLKLQTGSLKLQVCTDSIVRVRYSPKSTFPDAPDYVVVKKNWPGSQFQFQSGDKDVSVTTPRLKIVVTRADSQISFLDAKGGTLLQDGPRLMHPPLSTARRRITRRCPSDVRVGRGAVRARAAPGGRVELSRADGRSVAGEHQDRGSLLVSTNGYGIFWNNTSRSRFNNRFVHYALHQLRGSRHIDYYFIYGPEADQIIGHYRELTGEAPLFGRWAYGFWQCKNKYQSQAGD